ncbi:MAG: DUF2461 domain-containing protein [Candidatus Sulfopaludibacter sp.]|nr:DUF2461 domain-containing protein [Candidatus Sulfopaludibacter sp.]
MPSAFSGFPPEAMQFFRGLARNNNRDWFLPRKSIFEEKVKQPMRELVELVNGGMQRYAPDHVNEPDKAIYRFYRDTRFSKDKTPYKDRIAATFPRCGMARHEGAGYYFAVSHKEVAIGGGVYMPMPETLRAIREHIAAHPGEFRRLIGGTAVKKLYGEVQGEQLSRVPKGFPCDHPAADLLRYKQFLFYVTLPPEIAADRGIAGTIATHFRAIAGFVDFLNAPFARKKKNVDARELLL